MRRARGGWTAPAPVLGVLLGVLLAGCSSAPAPVPASAPEATRPAAGTGTAPTTPRPAARSYPAADRLLDEAAAACSAGDVDAGLAHLDRALRIAPQHAGLYLQMARCYTAAGDAGRAAAAAERGLSVCSGPDCQRLRRFLNS